MTPSSKPKLPALTSVRAIAAWWVVLFHVKEHLAPLLPAVMLRTIGLGYIGVDLFFVLSGFVIELNYGDRMRGGVQSWGDFLKRRFARIYPLHFVVLSAISLYALLVYAHSGHLTANYDFAFLPAHFLLVQAWGIDPSLRWNDPAWSISAEMLAYLVFPVMAVVARPRTWPLAIQIAGIAVLVGLLWLGFRIMGANEIGQDVMRLGVLRCLIEFAIGNILCAIFLARRQQIGKVLPMALVGAALGVALTGPALGVSDVVSVPLGFALLVIGLAYAGARGRTILDSRVLVFLGDISYSTYLSHFALLIVVKNFQASGNLIPPVELVAYFVAVAVASILLYTFVELPAQRVLLGRMGLGPGRARAVPAP